MSIHKRGNLCIRASVHIYGRVYAHSESPKRWTTAQHKCNQHWQAHSFGPVLFEARQTPESIGPNHKQHAQQTTPEQTQI